MIDPREYRFEGAANFRDLGGLETIDGRVVRRGRIFRSDALHRLTEVDLATLQGFDLRTVIDFRAEDEVRRSGSGLLASLPIRHINLPIVDVEAPTDAEAVMVDLYIGLMRAAAGSFRDLFHHLAEPDGHPVIMHCLAGKDRTGIASALVLSTLGVTEELIAADYALSGANMMRLLEMNRATGMAIPIEQIPSVWLEANPETIHAVFGAIVSTWGSVSGYLHSIGVSPDVRSQLHDALLEYR